MSQSIDDLTRSDLRAIRGHYSCSTSRRGAPGLPVTGTSQSRPAKGAGGSGGHRGLGGKEFCDDASVTCNATALRSARLR
jgi:hypothetical protein